MADAATEQVADTIFILIRDACAQAVLDGQRVIRQSKLAKENPEFLAHLDNIFDALSVKVCEVRLRPEWVEEAAQRIKPIILPR